MNVTLWLFLSNIIYINGQPSGEWITPEMIASLPQQVRVTRKTVVHKFETKEACEAELPRYDTKGGYCFQQTFRSDMIPQDEERIEIARDAR